jgi:hypothetical protein
MGSNPIIYRISKGTDQSFLKGRSSNDPKTNEEMLSITDHKGNANQNHVKIPPHSSLNA